jgi:hypothetical protein
MIACLKADSEKWEAERRASEYHFSDREFRRSYADMDYHNSATYWTRHGKYVPTAHTAYSGAASAATSQEVYDSNGMNESQEHSYGEPVADYQSSYSHSTRGTAEAPRYLGVGELDSTSHASSEDMILNFGDGSPIVVQGSPDGEYHYFPYLYSQGCTLCN